MRLEMLIHPFFTETSLPVLAHPVFLLSLKCWDSPVFAPWPSPLRGCHVSDPHPQRLGFHTSSYLPPVTPCPSASPWQAVLLHHGTFSSLHSGLQNNSLTVWDFSSFWELFQGVEEKLDPRPQQTFPRVGPSRVLQPVLNTPLERRGEEVAFWPGWSTPEHLCHVGVEFH